MPLSIEIYVLYNSLAMCMDITETYDDMIGLRLLLYSTCVSQKRHIYVTKLKLGVYEFDEQLQTYYKNYELTFVDCLKAV